MSRIIRSLYLPRRTKPLIFVALLVYLMVFLNLQYENAGRLSSASLTSSIAFPPPEDIPYRYPDTIDTFQSYKSRNTCDISSLQLHSAFGPLCHDRASMLSAMSSGGRIGNDAPYMPRGCDMRWFSSEEVCEILGRFDRIVLIGDSMLRHVMGSINILIRKDIGYGAVTDWNFSADERYHIQSRHFITN